MRQCIKKILSLMLSLAILIGMVSNLPVETTAAEDWRAWSQSDSRWGSIKLGNSSDTMSNSGCLVTSVAKIMVQSGLVDISSFTVETLITWLNNNNTSSDPSFTNSGGLYYAKPTKMVSGFSLVDYQYGKNNDITGSSSSCESKLLDLVDQNYHIILHVKNGGHYIAVDNAKSIETGHIYIMDSLASSPNADVLLTSRYSTITDVLVYSGWSQAGLDRLGYLQECTPYYAHCTIEATADTSAMTLPCSSGTNSDSTVAESITKGDTYTAIGLILNTAGNYWYKIKTSSGDIAYAPSGKMDYVSDITSDLTISNANAPTTITEGNSFSISGNISANYNDLTTVAAYVYSGQTTTGTPVTGGSATVSGQSYSLSGSAVDNKVVFGNLSPGTYTYVVTATITNYYAATEKTQGNNTHTITLKQSYFTVTEAADDPAQLEATSDAVNLTLGGTESADVTFYWTGSNENEVYLYFNCSNDNVSCSWGEWSSRQIPLTITAYAMGSTTITVDLKDSETDEILDTYIVYAYVDAETYTVSYNPCGGSNAPESQNKYHGTDLVLSSDVPTWFGHNFVGWATDPSTLEVVYQPGDTYTDNASIGLYAVWSGHTINDGFGITMLSPEINYGGVGYYYEYTAEMDGRIRMESGGYSDTVVYLYDASGNLLASDDDSGGNNLFFLDYYVTAGETYFIYVKFFDAAETGILNFYLSRPYFIEYDANGGTNAPTNQIKYHGTGFGVTLSSSIPTRFGYMFGGWVASDGTQYEPGDTYTEDASTVLTAMWEEAVEISGSFSELGPIHCPVYYGGTGHYTKFIPYSSGYYRIYGNDSEDNKIYLYDVSGNLLASDDDSGTDAQFLLDYYFTEGETYYIYVTFYSSSVSGSVSYSILKGYTISYYANGGSAAPTDQISYHGLDVTLSSAVPTRNGYIFLGWSTDSEATVAQYQPGDVFTVNEDVELYAVWGQSVTQITLNKTTIALEVSDTYQMTATVVPADAVNRVLSWSSSNEDVAFVDENGLVTAVGSGTAVITATATDGSGVTASCTVTVTDSAATESTEATAGESSIVASGTCGENVTWTLNVDGLLTISGSGAMTDYGFGATPWDSYEESICSIVVDDSVTSLSRYAFEWCTSLTSVKLPASLTAIADGAFAYCPNLHQITLPDNVEIINASAFSNCGLTSITLPKNLKTIANGAFYNCDDLVAFNVDPDNIYLSNDEYGVLFNKEQTELVLAPNGMQGYYVMPETVTSIANSAFQDCEELTGIEIPDGVTQIGDYVFYYCTGLSDVQIPDSVTSIGVEAFYYCTSLSEITIPQNVTSISRRAFDGCHNLKEITFTGDAPAVEGTIFSDVTAVAYYDPERSGWEEATQGDYGGLISWKVIGDETETVWSGTCGGNLTWTLDQGGALTVSGTGDMYDYVTVREGEEDVEYVYPEWSSGSFAAVIIEDGVTSIGDDAFTDCSALETVTIAGSVTRIGYIAFYGCDKLREVTFLGNAPEIDSAAFMSISPTCYYPADNATWTEEVLQEYGGTVTWVAYEPPVEIVDSGTCGENVTWKLNADGLLTISGEGSMYDYEQDGSPFYGNTAITSVIIDEGVTGIGSNSFRYCQNLQSVSIPDSVLSIGDTAFHFCSNLTNIQFGSGLVSIGYSAFNSCGSLLEVVIPDGVVSLGELAFAYCYGLERVVIPETVETIGRFAFGYGQALQSITVAEQNDHYSSDDTGVLFDKDKTQLICAPKLIEGAYSIPESVITIAPSAFRGCTHLTDITIPEGVLMIEDSAFSYCTGLTSIYIPGSVISIGTAAFSDCYNLQKFQVADSNITYCSDDTGVLFNKDKTRLLCAPGMLEGAYTIPGSVTSIDSEAFSNCQKLTDITIPEGVTAIEAWTFYNCRGLTSVTIPNSVVTIGSLAFANCRNATIIVLGNNVERIANQAFHYCSSLASIVIPASVTEIGSWAFENCSSLAEIIFEGDAPSIVLSAFNGINATAKYPATNTTWNEDTLLNYGGSLTWEAYNLSEEATASGSCGENITWTLDANGLLTISGTGAMYDYGEDPSPFYDRSDIIHVVIEDGVTTIGDSAFACCWNLESVSIANTVTTIGCTAFGDCCDLDEVTIPASVVTIRPWAFSCCDSLKKIVFEGDAPANDGSYIYENLYYSACAYYPIDNPTWTEAVMNSYGEEVSWVAYEYDADEIVFTGTSLSLNGDIGVNFYVQFAEELLADENLRMVLNVAGEAREVALADALIDVQDDGSVWYRFSCSVAAKEMADLITVQMYSTRGAIGQCKTYPAKWYYTDICGQFDREEKAELFALIEAMLNYGAASQEYFGYNTESLANAEVAAAVPETVDASSFAGAVSDTDALLDYAGASLVLESNTVLRVFFRPVTGADISSHAFTVNGETVTPVQRGNLWYIELTDIAAKELDTAYTFTAGDVTVECSALSYVNAVLSKADALDEKLVAVCKALYAYNEAANTYFGA